MGTRALPNAADGGRLAFSDRRSGPKSPRYSRFVNLMKVALPSLAAAVVLMIVLWPAFQPTDRAMPLGYAMLEPVGASPSDMVNARFVGTDEADRPFTITAERVQNLVPDSTDVTLEQPKADLTLEDGTWVVLTAGLGQFDMQAEALDLDGDVTLLHDGGYAFHTRRATVDLDAGTAHGTDPVEGHGPIGDVKGEGFRLLDEGRTLVLEGKSRVVLYPDAEGPKP